METVNNAVNCFSIHSNFPNEHDVILSVAFTADILRLFTNQRLPSY